MNDYISREAAVEYLMTNMGWHDEDGYPVDDADEKRKIIADLISGIPAADVRPVVKARWYWDNYRYDWCCGNCFHPADHYIDKDDVYKKPSFKFCPHCGADMREVKSDEKYFADELPLV